MTHETHVQSHFDPFSTSFRKDWTETPIKTLYRRVSRKGFPEEKLLSVYRDYGVVPKESRDDNHNQESEDLSSYQLVKVGDLAINKMKAWQGSLSVSEFQGIVSPAYFIYSPRTNDDPRYLHYLLSSKPLVSAYAATSKGIRPGQWDLDPNAFANLKVSIPCSATQCAIADFLDRETSRIDTLIAEQERLIALLRERRIEQVRGALQLSSSNHLIVDKLGRSTKIGNGSTPRRENLAYWESGSIPWLTSTVANSRRVRIASQFVTRLAQTDCHLPLVPAKSILVGLTGQGKTRGSVTVLDFEATLNQHLAFVIPNPTIWIVEFLYWSLFAKYDELRNLSEQNGSTKGGLTCEQLKRVTVSRPHLEEQRRIAKFLDAQALRIDTLIAETEKFIELSRERRAALITAAVTGQIDVREEVA